MFVFDFNFWVNVLTLNSLLEKLFGFVLFHSYFLFVLLLLLFFLIFFTILLGTRKLN